MLKWVSLEQVRFGMYIHEIDCSWIKHPFWRRSFLLESADDLQLLHTIGIKRVRIDSGRGLDVDLSLEILPSRLEFLHKPSSNQLLLEVRERCRWRTNWSRPRAFATMEDKLLKSCTRKRGWAMPWTRPKSGIWSRPFPHPLRETRMR
jgi:hypothetical protein